MQLNGSVLKKQQLILAFSGLVLLLFIYFFGNTIPPKNPEAPQSAAAPKTVTAEEEISSAKKDLTATQSAALAQLENSVVRGDVKDQQIRIFGQLANFWRDTLHRQDLYAYYLGEQAKLENSEKNLNFAGRLLLANVLAERDPSRQTWLATNAKELFERSLEIDPSNDSAKVSLGACYLFGNISSTPMEGILKIKEVAERDPHNMYAWMMLGLGDIKSGQYDKAIERLNNVVVHEPQNLQAIFNLAETYERKGDYTNAIKWYREAQQLIGFPEAKMELEKRIQELQSH